MIICDDARSLSLGGLDFRYRNNITITSSIRHGEAPKTSSLDSLQPVPTTKKLYGYRVFCLQNVMRGLEAIRCHDKGPSEIEDLVF